MDKIFLATFPGGSKQVEEETGQLHALLRGKLSREDSRQLLLQTKALLLLSDDKSEARIIDSIQRKTEGNLTRHEAHLIYVFLTGVSGPITTGGDGSSEEQAVIINATSSIVGIFEEYAYVERVCGKRDVDYTLQMQMQTTLNGQQYDVLDVQMKDGTRRSFWFDITSFFGKF